MRFAIGLSLVLAGCAAAAADPGKSAPPTTIGDPEPMPKDANAAAAEPQEAPARDFFGKGYPPAVPAGQAQIGSLTWGTWIQPKPDSRSLPLGSIRVGSTLPLLEAGTVKGMGKCREFVRVARGFVCATRRATLDLGSDYLQASRWTTPAPGPFPYEYAFSLGAPMLTRAAPKEEMHWKTGPREYQPLWGWAVGHDELADSAPIEPNGETPEFLQNGATAPSPWGRHHGVYFKTIPFGSMLAYTRAFEAEGRTWVLSTNLTVVPAEGLMRFRRSKFHGVELGHGTSLPIAWMRRQPRAKWKHTPDGFEPTGETWPLRGWTALTGKEVRDGQRTFLETREPGIFIEAPDATRVELVTKRPWEVKGDAKWIHVRVNRGTLTLYEGMRPVFTTLMSPGQGGATPYGRYHIESKHHVSTMSPESGEPRKFWIADVPWTMYFKRPYAIHGAYWHEDFGERKSGGCVNLSPIDAKRVFDWAEPELPEGWGSVQGYGMGGGTFVLVEG